MPRRHNFNSHITPSLYQLSYVNILLSEMFILLDCVRPKLNNIQFLFVLHLYGDANHLTLVDAYVCSSALTRASVSFSENDLITWLILPAENIFVHVMY